MTGAAGVLPDFVALFGRPPAVQASAPGRVNLIGEHTDYNGGYVLPSAIPQRTRVELALRPDGVVRAASPVMGTEVHEYHLGAETRGAGWLDYVQGITRVLQEGGFAFGGFDARIESDVPVGAGLASSAALEVALLRALREAFRLTPDDVQLALLGQRAEVEFVGARVGVMDQMAASLAGPDEALFIDTCRLTYERLPLPSGTELIVIDSGVAHNHAAGDYNTRRAECERAAALLGVELLSEITEADLHRLHALPEPLGRRARHVVTENARVLAAVRALRSDDPLALGALFASSHASMRDDYEVSIPEVDRLVRLAGREPEIFGARLTGGGFGGAVVMLARRGKAAPAASRIARAYGKGKVLLPAFT